MHFQKLVLPTPTNLNNYRITLCVLASSMRYERSIARFVNTLRFDALYLWHYAWCYIGMCERLAIS